MRLLRGGADNKYLVVINPMSRMGKGLRIALWTIARLVLHRVDFEAVLTKRAGHAERIVAEYEAPVDVVVAIGGDGTIQEVLNGIKAHQKPPALAVVPAGRGNDFCTLIGIGRSKRKALRYMLSPDTARVDLLRFNGRYATNIVGVGYDAMVQAKSQHYRFFPVIRYLLNAILILLRGYTGYRMKVRYEGGVAEGKYIIAVAGHTRKYARQIRLFPGLKIDGGVMKVAVIRSTSSRILNVLLLFSAGMAFAHLFPPVRIIETPWVEIEVDETVKAQSDGDLFYLGPDETLRVDLVRKGLEIKAP